MVTAICAPRARVPKGPIVLITAGDPVTPRSQESGTMDVDPTEVRRMMNNDDAGYMVAGG
jgi:hypothetical protein